MRRCYHPLRVYWTKGPILNIRGDWGGRATSRDRSRVRRDCDAGMPVADVQDAFSTTNFDTFVTLPGFGQVPVNVARICQWTWMCAPPPIGPNVHGRPEGYWVMASAFLIALAPGP